MTEQADPTFSLETLARLTGSHLIKSERPVDSIKGVSTLSDAWKSDCAVFHNPVYQNALKASRAALTVMRERHTKYAPKSMSILTNDNPYKAFTLITQAFFPKVKKVGSISIKSYISASAKIEKGCVIHPGAFIGENVSIGNNTEIGVNAYIGDDVLIGDECVIENNASIMHAELGNNTIIHTGARIGQDGFGFASDKNGHYKLPHRGGVRIGSHVEIGANTCIDRGTFTNTLIEDHCHLDNLVHIGHNVKLGKGVVLVGQAAIAGSSEIGEFVSMGGQAGVSGHIKVGKHAVILAQSGVIDDIPAYGRYAGMPAIPATKWHRLNRYLKNLILGSE